jgi:hypothetical protein
VGDEKCFITLQRAHTKMFEPECQNIDCPKCCLGKIYFDRQIGYYCMLCGYAFGATGIEMLIGKITLTLGPAEKLENSPRKSIVEIRELPAGKTKTKLISRDVIGPGKPER